MVATQSPYLLDKLNLNSIFVLTLNKNNETEIKIIDKSNLEEWLKEYSIGDLWLMNIFGG